MEGVYIMEGLLKEIYSKMDAFKECSSCGRRQYLASAKALYDLELRLEEMENFGDDITNTTELEEINRKAGAILQNCGIVYRIKVSA